MGTTLDFGVNWSDPFVGVSTCKALLFSLSTLSLRSVCFSPGDKFVLTASDDGSVLVGDRFENIAPHRCDAL